MSVFMMVERGGKTRTPRPFEDIGKDLDAATRCIDSLFPASSCSDFT